MTNRYGIGQEVYLRASAAIGILEPVFVAGIYTRGGGWMYTFRVGTRTPIAPPVYGNQQNLNAHKSLYLSEDELVLKCDAFAMVRAHAQALLDRIINLQAVHCPQD